MTLLQEIQDKCSQELIASQDYETIAAVVNVDRKKVIERKGGFSLVMSALGRVTGAALLKQLKEQADAGDTVLFYTHQMLEKEQLNFGDPETIAAIDQYVPEPLRQPLKNLSLVDDHVTAQQVASALTGGM